jgi:uncharacterized membrane protein
MTLYFLIKYLHVLGAIVILGTGTGIAFFMLMAHRSRDVAYIARTAETVVIADMLFTLTAVLLQPVTGGLLMMLSSTAIGERWLLTSLGLYAVAGLFWVPVIFMQIEMHDLARKGGGTKPGVAATILCTFPPLVCVWDSRFWRSHGYSVVDNRQTALGTHERRDAKNPGARRFRSDRRFRRPRFARSRISGGGRRAKIDGVAQE